MTPSLSEGVRVWRLDRGLEVDSPPAPRDGLIISLLSMAEQDLRDDSVAEENQDHSSEELGECISTVCPQLPPQERWLNRRTANVGCEIAHRWLMFTFEIERSASTILTQGSADLFVGS